MPVKQNIRPANRYSSEHPNDALDTLLPEKAGVVAAVMAIWCVSVTCLGW